MSLLLLSLVVLAAAAAPATSNMSEHDTRLLIKSYGDCVVGKHQRTASKAILANVSNAELMHKYWPLIDRTCVPLQLGQTVQMRFQGDQYRYALADGLFRRELASIPAPSLEPVPLLDHAQPTEPSRTDANGRPLSDKKYQEAMDVYQRQKAFAALSLYGECVVRTDPAAARSLLLTEPDSPAEAAQFAAMRTALGTCLPEGRTLSLGKLALRGTIAVNYYRLAKAALGIPVAEGAK